MLKLGYQPRFSLREALPGVVRWYDEHSHVPADERVVQR